MIQITKKALRTSIVQVCSFLCIFTLSSCKDAGPPEPIFVSEELVQQPVSGKILEITPYGVVTLGVLKDGVLYEQFWDWCDYHIFANENDSPPYGKKVWRTYGQSIVYRLKGTAKVGDMADVYHLIETRAYPSGDSLSEVVAAYVKKK